MSRFDAVIFDLDGTLADTLTDLAAATNHALDALGLPTIELAGYRSLVGQGLQYLITHALGPEHGGKSADAERLFREYYVKHMGDHTRVYPGVKTMLKDVAERGLKRAVLTNKPHEAAVKFTRIFFTDAGGGRPFDAVQGHAPPTLPKPDPAGAMRVVEALGVAPDRCAYLGDTDVDMVTGRAAGFFTVGCAWGFRPDELADAGAQTIIDRPQDLARILDGHG